MAEKSEPREPDGSWVLAGTEGLPIDVVGAEQDSASRGDEDEEPAEEGPWDTSAAATPNGAAAFPQGTPRPAGSGLGDSEECWDPGTDGSAEPVALDGGEQEEPDAEAEPGPCPDTLKAGPPTEEGSCTSSDDDTEGLRHRQGHEPHAGPPPPAPEPRRGTLDTGDENGLNVSKFLLGALALVAVGLLVVSGGIYDPGDGSVESVASQDMVAEEQESPLLTDSNGSQQNPPLRMDTGDPQSVQSMSFLLDKLAKENQEIRLMQAELQAHKEELHTLLRGTEGEATAGAQLQSLAAENARLRAALERDAALLRDARAELQRLQAAGAPGGSPGAGEPAAEQPPGTGAPACGEDTAPRCEGARRHGWLASVRQELASALERARGPGGLQGLVENLRALEQRLGQELEAEGAESFPGRWKKPFKAEKKESKRHKRHGAGEDPHEREGKPHGHGKHQRPPREHKPGKTWEKSSHGARQHGHRELAPFSRYRAPQGCSGVADCARKEGREVLGTALEPVQKAQFLQLLEGFMGQLGWGGHFGGLAARLDGAFGADGAFAHDRLRFVDFVDDVEELLEDVARRERGDEEAADGFEEYVLRHYAGDSGAARKEQGRKATRQHGAGR